MPTNPFNADLDVPQILNKVYNPTDDTIRVDANVTAIIGDVVIDAATSSVKAELAAPPAGTITQSQRTIGTTAVRATVSGSAPSPTRTVLAITADAASTAFFYIGSSTVTASGPTAGIQFNSSQPVIFSNDAADYWIVSDTAGQLVDFLEQE